MDKEFAEKSAMVLVLDGELAIQRAVALRESLMDRLLTGNAIDLDLSNVTAIDVSGLQLLCSMHRTARNAGGDIRIASPLSAAVAQMVESAGFARRHVCRSNSSSRCLWDLGDLK